jgi:hypothetical protein
MGKTPDTAGVKVFQYDQAGAQTGAPTSSQLFPFSQALPVHQVGPREVMIGFRKSIWPTRVVHLAGSFRSFARKPTLGLHF